MGALYVGGDQIQIAMQTPAAVAQILQGAILFFMLGGMIFANYKVRILRDLRKNNSGADSHG